MLIVILCFSIVGEALTLQAAFEVAAVKRRIEPGGGFIGRQPGGRFTAQGASLQDLIVFAYRLQPYQIIGGHPWLNQERWDISATGALGTPDDVLVALQHLLADRFSLVVHRDMQQLPIFALVLGRSDGRLGTQLKHSSIDCAQAKADAAKTGLILRDDSLLCNVQGRVGSIRMGGSPLSEFTTILADRLQRYGCGLHRPSRRMGLDADLYATALANCPGRTRRAISPHSIRMVPRFLLH